MTLPDDPHELHARLARFRKSAADESFLLSLNRLLAAADLAPRRPGIAAEYLPIVYVVGAPRSGTTLLSQLASRFLPLGYVNNLIARFWLRPAAGIRLSRILLGDRARESITFDSTHGVTAGIAGPHEFGYFWRHWLRLDESPTHHLDQAALSRVDAEGLRRVLVDEILSEFRAPVVFKNVICGFQASFLAAVHPASLFVHIRRDPYATAASILKSRMERYGTYSAWWSLKPSAYPAIAALPDPAVQVARQLEACLAELDIELARPGVRTLSLRYEDMCADPVAALSVIAGAIGAMGTPVGGPCYTIPALSAASPASLPGDLVDALRRALAGVP